MMLTFKSGKEYIRFNIDRKNKILKLTSSLTNYREKLLPWRYLFDKGKEEEQERITDKMEDKEFIAVITIDMANKGYALKNAS